MPRMRFPGHERGQEDLEREDEIDKKKARACGACQGLVQIKYLTNPIQSSKIRPMDPSSVPRHPLRVAERRTQLTAATLRAWERRYGAVRPDRSEGGHRLYSDRDITRLQRLRTLVEWGRPIRTIATLSDEEIEALIAEERAAGEEAPPSPSQPSTSGPRPLLLDACLEKVASLDRHGLEALLRRSAAMLDADSFLEGVAATLLREVGDAWVAGELSPAQEHACSATVRKVLTWLADIGAAGATGPPLVVATLQGERHGLGAELVATAAVLEGWSVTNLGVDLPPSEVARAAELLDAHAVLLSFVYRDLPGTIEVLAELRKLVPPGVAVVIGGAAADRFEASTLPVGVRRLASLRDLRRHLARAGAS